MIWLKYVYYLQTMGHDEITLEIIKALSELRLKTTPQWLGNKCYRLNIKKIVNDHQSVDFHFKISNGKG